MFLVAFAGNCDIFSVTVGLGPKYAAFTVCHFWRSWGGSYSVILTHLQGGEVAEEIVGPSPTASTSLAGLKDTGVAESDD